jgi:hypothetical protein
MQCPNCKTIVSKKAKFCPSCGKPIADEANISVRQEVGKVKGAVVGQALKDDKLPAGLKSTTTQKIDSVEAGGVVVGASIGDGQQIGGQRQYGDSIHVGDIKDSSNVAIGKSNRITVTQGASAEEIARAFSILLQAVQAKAESPEKALAQTAVQGLESEAAKGEDADEGKVQTWFDHLGNMAPDILEVALDTFTNPVKGISTVFKKVAERAKAEKGK